MDSAPQKTDAKPYGGVPGVPVAIYTRVSTERQVGGRYDSCDHQALICREYISRQAAVGWYEMGYFTDAAYSGGTLDRPGLKSLMKEIASGAVKVVLIYKFERIMRSTYEWGRFHKFLDRYGCRLVSPAEDHSDATATGQLKTNMLATIAEYERLNTAEKARSKLLEQARRGQWNGGMVPYGYDYDLVNKRLMPNSAEASLIRQIYEKAAQMVSLEEIAQALNEDGHRTKPRRFRRQTGDKVNVGSRMFRSDGLRIMIGNPIYRGAVRFKGEEFPGQHEPLVSMEQWERANAVVMQMTKTLGQRLQSRDKHWHLLKGFVFCGSCGRALVPHDSGKTGRRNKIYRYYDCSHLIKERRATPCPVRRIAADGLEKAVISFLGELSKHPELVEATKEASMRYWVTRKRKLLPELKKVNGELGDVEQRLRNCIEVLANGGTEVLGEELKAEILTVKNLKWKLLAHVQRLNRELEASRDEAISDGRIRQAVEKLSDLLATLSREDQRQFVSLLVERIEVRPADDEPIVPRASRRQYQLQIKLHIPRLVQGMEERVLVDSREVLLSRNRKRLVTLETNVSFGKQDDKSPTIILTPFQHVVTKASSGRTNGVAATASVHPIHRSIEWQARLKRDQVTRQTLARRLRVSASTVTDHIKLLSLNPEIQDFLAGLATRKEVWFYSVNRLKLFANLRSDEQRERFERMQAEYAARG